MSSFPGAPSERQAVRRYGRLAGILFLSGSALAIPTSLVLAPELALAAYLVTALGIATGLACFAIPWERISPRWFQAVAVCATGEVALVTAVYDRLYAFYFFLVAVYVAYVFAARWAIAFHLLLIAAAFAVQAAIHPGQAQEILDAGLIALPTVALTAGTVAYLSERVAASRRAQLDFAARSLELTMRIRGADDPGELVRARDALREQDGAAASTLLRH